MSATCRRSRSAPGGADPPRRGASHPRLSGSVDQAAAADGALARRAGRDRQAGGRLRGDRRRLWTLGAPSGGRRFARAGLRRGRRAFSRAPYLWGGRTSEGIDCSGLVQAALTAAGVAAPRDSDMMEAALGEPSPAAAPLARGDLVFWKGHVGVMRDAGDAASRERLAHGGRQRAARRGARPHRRQRRRRGDERKEISASLAAPRFGRGRLTPLRARSPATRLTSCRRCRDRRSGC